MTALGYAWNAEPFRRLAERLPIASLPEETESVRVAFLVAAAFEDWDCRATRPRNAPERRLRDAASVVTQTPMMSLADVGDFSSGACRQMVTAMCGGGCMGRGRAGAIVANVIVPFALAEGRATDAPDWLPPEDVSGPVRLTASRMFGRDHNPAAFYATNGLLIQGLLQIHRDCCLQVHPDCRSCGLVAAAAAVA